MDARIVRHLQVLELEPGATLAEVRVAYRDLVQVWHPDRFPHSERLQVRAKTRLQEINAAYAEVTAWLERQGARPTPPPSPRPASPPPPSEAPRPPPPPPEPSARVRARVAEHQRRRQVALGPWAELDLDHAVLRGPGDGQVACVSQGLPMPFVRKAYDQDRWITTVAAGPGCWLTVATRWGRVQRQQVHQAPDAEARMKAVRELYAEGYGMTAYAQAADGVRLTVMTDGVCPGSEHYQSFADWPRDWIRQQRQEHEEAVVLVSGGGGRWHVATAQVPGFGGQRLALRSDFDGLKAVLQTAWEEGRKLTALAWQEGTYVMVATEVAGWGPQVVRHASTTEALARNLDEQWSEGRVLTSACYDDDGWLCVFTPHPEWG